MSAVTRASTGEGFPVKCHVVMFTFFRPRSGRVGVGFFFYKYRVESSAVIFGSLPGSQSPESGSGSTDTKGCGYRVTWRSLGH